LLHIDSLARGGSQQQLVNLAVGMAGRAHEVMVVTYASENAHKATLELAGISVICTGKRHRLDPMPIVKLVRQTRRFRADCVVAFLRTPGIYAEMARLFSPGVPLIVSERAGLVHGQLRVMDRVSAVLHLLATRVNGNSRSYMDALCKFFPPLKKRAVVIYNGVSELYFQTGEETFGNRASKQVSHTHSSRTNEGAPEPLKLLVVAARPCRDKGLFVLIDALSRVVSGGRKYIQMTWIGPSDADHPLVDAEEVAEANRIIEASGLKQYWQWSGPMRNLHEVYPQFDVLLLPSLHEGTPNTMCEAMSCALPVVVTDIADSPYLIAQRKHGYVCSVGSASSLAQSIEAIYDLSSDARRQMGDNAFLQARSLFSMDHFLDSWEALIADAVDKDGN
jgi:glycosyltransferase involved in cell wall biosynthesis